MYRRALDLMEHAVASRHFPSACLLAAVSGQPVVHQAFGDARLETLFDLASLTKPLCTTAVVMQLVSRGELSLEDRAGSWIPELGRRAGRVRVRELLAHTAGVPAWRSLYQHAPHLAAGPRREAIRRLVASEPLEAAPGSRTVYSDLGFILLDWLLERCTGDRLDHLARTLVFEPLGLSHTLFVDLARPGQRPALLSRHRFAPTEQCPTRGRRLVAEVHDDNCRAMGGVAGHAGLFSTAHDVHLLVRELVDAFHGRRSLFDPRVARRFLRPSRRPAQTRALGWDIPSAAGSSAGRHFPPGSSVGHLGFTGTSIWIDLRRKIWVVLLTNRVYFGREPNPMKAFRPLLHDALLESMAPESIAPGLVAS